MQNDVSRFDAARELFVGYSTVAVIANSEATAIAELRRTLPEDTLFVFFNEATRVLAGPFDRPSILVARSGKEGPAIVRKGKIAGILECFAPGALRAVVNLRSGDRENFAKAEEFGFPSVRFLDLTEHFRSRYTQAKTASSGYAVLAWLVGLKLDAQLRGIGFTGRRTERWKVFDVHDWVLERVGLRLFELRGDVVLDPSAVQHPSALGALRAQFPDADPIEIASVGVEVLSQRLERTDMFIDRLWSVTVLSRGIREGLKVFRKRKGVRL